MSRTKRDSIDHSPSRTLLLASSIGVYLTKAGTVRPGEQNRMPFAKWNSDCGIAGLEFERGRAEGSGSNSQYHLFFSFFLSSIARARGLGSDLLNNGNGETTGVGGPFLRWALLSLFLGVVEVYRRTNHPLSKYFSHSGLAALQHYWME